MAECNQSLNAGSTQLLDYHAAIDSRAPRVWWASFTQMNLDRVERGIRVGDESERTTYCQANNDSSSSEREARRVPDIGCGNSSRALLGSSPRKAGWYGAVECIPDQIVCRLDAKVLPQSSELPVVRQHRDPIKPSIPCREAACSILHSCQMLAGNACLR